MTNRKLVYLTEIKTGERFREDNNWKFVLEQAVLDFSDRFADWDVK